ncbi:hypothetical protein P5E39_13030 [Clostridium perfringens]|uniref:hypothetical protein n=1 Tax=Clostridium perfringens TaxID=1502 RepID=UPI002979D9A1|nr:hypothetical protein [Clostridium perfringens]MDK0835030.1 hypothetical protein [Clostridium perfringens]MDM0495351.1 hypothetical protein [Clostridium perfringens]MDM0781067.1 hypothetical protein [Clostridium perfringens]
MTRKFKLDLETIYERTNALVKEIQREETSDLQKNFLIGDLIDISKELVLANCRKFIDKYSITEITKEELYVVAVTTALYDVLEWFSFEKGNNFMPMWELFMNNRFNNELTALCSEKQKWFRGNVCSSDKELNSDGTTVLELVGERDFAESVCSEITLGNLLSDFEKMDKHGAVIKCFSIQSQEHRREAIMKALGVEEYNSTVRKQVQRVKERFIKFLVKNNYDISKYI